MNQATLTQQLTALVFAKPIDPDDLAQAALFTLDALANAFAGRCSPPGALLRRWSEQNRADAGRRALLLGALTHILEVDDLHRASVVHPGCVVVPAAWVLAERQDSDGKALLTAVLRGFEATTRVGMAVGTTHYRYWHNTATCGPFGSAMAAASLLGLSTAETVHALGNAGTQAAGFWQFLETGAMTKHLHAGRGAEAGVVAAELAQLGFTGPPAILEGNKGFFAAACPDADPAAVTRNPEAPWQLRQTSLKPWPSCRHTHPAVDAALEIRNRLDHLDDPARIAKVTVATYPAALAVCDRPEPDSAYAAQFSLQHCVAAALTMPSIDFMTFVPATRDTLAELRQRVELQVAEPYASAYPQRWGSAISVTLTDGTRLEAQRDHAKGDPEAPLTQAEIVAKADMLLGFGGVIKAQALIDAILALPAGGPVPRLSDYGL